MPKLRKHKPLSDTEKARLAAFHADYATRTPRPVLLYGYKHRTAADAAEERLPLYTTPPLPKPQTPDRFPIMTTTRAKTPPNPTTSPAVTPVTPTRTRAEYKLVDVRGSNNNGLLKFEVSGEDSVFFVIEAATTEKFTWDRDKLEWTKN